MATVRDRGRPQAKIDRHLPKREKLKTERDTQPEDIVPPEPPPLEIPTFFATGQWDVSDLQTGGTARFIINSLPADGGSPITALQYRIDGGAYVNFSAPVPGQYDISGLTNTIHSVVIRAVNAVGPGPDSAAKTVTLTALTAPAAFTTGQWSVADTGAGGTIRIDITALPADGGSPITQLLYNVSGGAFVALVGTGIGFRDITGFTDGLPVNITLRADNAIGQGAISGIKTTTPTAAARTISITAGTGYAPSTYTSTVAGQWKANGVNIPGEVGLTHTMQIANEGAAITCVNSNAIELWVPTDAAGLVAWFDIRRGITEIGGRVRAWASQFGGLGVTQDVGANFRPVYNATIFNGAPGLDCASTYMEGLVISSTPASRTWIGGVRFAAANGPLLLAGSGTGGYILYNNPSNNVVVLARGGATLATDTVVVNNATYMIMSSRFTQGGAFAFDRGDATTTSGTATGALSGTAASSYIFDFGFSGVLTSHLIYDAYLSDSDKNKAEGYIAHTLNQMVLLGASHTYKVNAPTLALTNTVPAQFTAGQWSVADLATFEDAAITITALPSDGGSAITALQYDTSFNPGNFFNLGGVTTGTYNIAGLPNGVATNIRIRAVNSLGAGVASATKSVTPTGTAPVVGFDPFLALPNQMYHAYKKEDITEAPGVEIAGVWTQRGHYWDHADTIGPPYPIKAADGSGDIHFRNGMSQWMYLRPDGELPQTSRAGIHVFRCTLPTDPAGTILICFGSTGFGSPQNRQPMLHIQQSGLLLWSSYDAMGSAALFSTSPLITDGVTYNIVSWRLVNGKVFLRVNDQAEISRIFHGWIPSQGGGHLGCIGDSTQIHRCDVWHNIHLTWGGISSKKLMDCMHAWCKNRVAGPFSVPAWDYVNDDIDKDWWRYTLAAQNAWAATLAADKYSHRGEALPANYTTGYQRTLWLDFQHTDQFPVSCNLTDMRAPLFASGFIDHGPQPRFPWEGARAAMNWNNFAIMSVYDLNTAGSGSLKIQRELSDPVDAAVFFGEITTANRVGFGRWLRPLGIWRIRYRYSNLARPLPGFFDSLGWYYKRSIHFQRWANRLEYDLHENTAVVTDPLRGDWVESNVHHHEPHLVYNPLPPNVDWPGHHNEMSGQTLDGPGAANPFPIKRNEWDGQWHTETEIFEAGMCKIYADEYERVRHQPHPAMLTSPSRWIVTCQPDRNHGARDYTQADFDNHLLDLEIDYIEWWEPDAVVNAITPPWSARPTISGTLTVGQVLTVTPNISGNITVRWFTAQGRPLPQWPDALTATITADVAGDGVRVMVQSLDEPLLPECWSTVTGPIAALGGTTTYYVSAAGSDSNNGTSTGTPWLTIAKVNATALAPNTTVAFRGGDTFTGTLDIDASGTVGNPITVTSYGTGRATISSGTGSAITITNRNYVTVDGINCTGNGTTNIVSGISVLNDQAGNVKLVGIIIKNCIVTGYGENGIRIYGNHASGSGTDGTLVEGCETYGNAFGALNSTHGIAFRAPPVYGSGWTLPGHINGIIRNCISHDNLGKSGQTNHTGSGIFIGQCFNTLIEGCTAYNNGANSNLAFGGPIGIWMGDCDACTIRSCTSYSNLSATRDGGGYDIDGGCRDCIIERCYSRNNWGAGYMVYSYVDVKNLGGAFEPCTGCVIRNNISINDGTGTGAQSAPNQAGIKVTSDLAGQTGIKVYNNTIYNNISGRAGAYIAFTSTHDYKLDNNIFYTGHAGAYAIKVIGDPGSVLFQGNSYFGSATNKISWNSVDYATVAAWQAVKTLQEKVSGSNVSISTDPLLASAGGLTAPDYFLLSGSPAVGSGLNLNTLHGWTVPVVDYFGNTVPNTSGYNMGAYGALGYVSAFLDDQFTDTNGTNISAHTPNVGGAWSLQTGYSITSVTIQGNQLAVTGAGGASAVCYQNAATPPNANYYVETELVFGTQTNSFPGPAGRMSAAADSFYHARYDTDQDAWQLMKIIAGSATFLGTPVSLPYPTGTTHTLRLTMNGSAISCQVDGTTIIGPITDTALTTAGKAGFRSGGNPSSVVFNSIKAVAI